MQPLVWEQCPKCSGKLQSLCRHGQLMEGLRGICQAIPHLCHSIVFCFTSAAPFSAIWNSQCGQGARSNSSAFHAASVNTTLSRDFLAPRTTSRRAKRETHRVRSGRRRAWFSVYPVHPCSIRAFKEDARARRGKPIGLLTSARLSHCRGVGRSGERETPPRREREQAREESNGRRGKRYTTPLRAERERQTVSRNAREREREHQ
ncbi:hypothetical protein E1301_Tti001572 [Triplophysa tibetana]|uniref:Uncharacterized protein n=1 Tax=Triplophysa tibetana TaxID=1572043 RepID=A0A5A9P5U7_9TELE|nr:hypothetical protein E1301_Tti001572 [Triplophysa tibetana]